MPFKSKRQLRLCFSEDIKTKGKGRKSSRLASSVASEVAKANTSVWNCEEFLRKTPNPTCLPELVGSGKTPRSSGTAPSGKAPSGCRNLRKDEKVVGPVYQGPRGGYYFFAKGVKVYVPKGEGNVEYAKKKYRGQEA